MHSCDAACCDAHVWPVNARRFSASGAAHQSPLCLSPPLLAQAGVGAAQVEEEVRQGELQQEIGAGWLDRGIRAQAERPAVPARSARRCRSALEPDQASRAIARDSIEKPAPRPHKGSCSFEATNLLLAGSGLGLGLSAQRRLLKSVRPRLICLPSNHGVTIHAPR